MPRFLPIHVACLKRTMLAWSGQRFMFTPQNVQAIVQETGLNQAQVQVWAENFRMRYTADKERLEYLRADGLDKPTNSVKMTRCFVSCFNITPEFFNGFAFPKSKGGGVFGIKYMEAVFNKEAESGEIFIEFDEYVWEHKLVECFEAQGAGQVTTITFAHNDGGDSAGNALVRILLAQEKHGGYSRGACPPALHAKAMAKRTEAKQKLQTVSQQEFDEKTTAAIRLSLGNIETGVQSQAAKLEGIEQGICHVIPDYQNENAKLKDALAKKTAACDTIEGKLAYKTRVINQQGKYIDRLDEDQKLLVQQNQALVSENVRMKDQLELSQHLKQTLEKSQHLADILSSTLADERAAKRARTQE